MLFDTTRHFPVSNIEWNPKLIKLEIELIIKDIECARGEKHYWPTHPLDAESYSSSAPKWSAYAGASGVIQALQILQRYEYQVQDLSGLLNDVHQSFLKSPDVSIEPGLQLGELGILIPALLARPDNDVLKALIISRMESTLALPYYEITSGQTGMMHVALMLYRISGKACWSDLFQQGAKALFDNWKQDVETGEWHWQSQVFGFKRKYYGACHGVAGNANILLQGVDLLKHGDADLIIERTVKTLVNSAHIENGVTNWLHFCNPEKPKMLVQWCHGAAGIITAMARTPKSESKYSHQLEQLLTDAGELVWQAGPLAKGSNICHGTAGNGYAFLYLYHRTGEELWLNRARNFAMDAIEQCRQSRIKYQQGRYTLWTGDSGLAIYLHHCLEPSKAAIPGLDLF